MTGRRSILAGRKASLCALGCTLVLVSMAPCAAADAERIRPDESGAADRLRDVRFVYRHSRPGRWPASPGQAVAFVYHSAAAGTESDPGEAPAVRDLTIGAAGALEIPPRAVERTDRLSWRAILTVHLLSVVADTYTTREALAAGATEGNPMYAWAGDRQALGVRLSVGIGVTFVLDSLHRDHPRLARALAVVAIIANAATSRSNERLTHP